MVSVDDRLHACMKMSTKVISLSEINADEYRNGTFQQVSGFCFFARFDEWYFIIFSLPDQPREVTWVTNQPPPPPPPQSHPTTLLL